MSLGYFLYLLHCHCSYRVIHKSKLLPTCQWILVKPVNVAKFFINFKCKNTRIWEDHHWNFQDICVSDKIASENLREIVRYFYMNVHLKNELHSLLRRTDAKRSADIIDTYLTSIAAVRLKHSNLTSSNFTSLIWSQYLRPKSQCLVWWENLLWLTGFNWLIELGFNGTFSTVRLYRALKI